MQRTSRRYWLGVVVGLALFLATGCELEGGDDSDAGDAGVTDLGTTNNDTGTTTCTCSNRAGACEVSGPNSTAPCSCDSDCNSQSVCSQDGYCDPNCPAGVDADCDTNVPCNCDTNRYCEARAPGTADTCECDDDCGPGDEACEADDHCDTYCPTSGSGVDPDCSNSCACEYHPDLSNVCEAAGSGSDTPCDCDDDCSGTGQACNADGHCDTFCFIGGACKDADCNSSVTTECEAP